MIAPDAVLSDFVHEAMYDPSVWFVDRIVSLEPDDKQIVAEMDTTALPFVAEQRVLPGHPRHVPAAIAIQATGTMGQLYAIYALGLRATEGWVGFGTKIEQARWGQVAIIGPPVTMTCTCTRTRKMMGTRFCWFSFEFEQEGAWVYRSSQVAAWLRQQAPPR